MSKEKKIWANERTATPSASGRAKPELDSADPTSPDRMKSWQTPDLLTVGAQTLRTHCRTKRPLYLNNT